MKHERRRDRIWKTALLTVYTKGEIQINDIDVSLTKTVGTRDEAEQLVNDEDYRSQEDIHKTSTGEWEVIVEPDASPTTKRSVLETMSKDRYGFLKKDENREGIWIAGPLYRAITSSLPTPGQSESDRTDDILNDIRNDPEIELEDSKYIIDQLTSPDNVAN